MARIPVFHPDSPGSIPGMGGPFLSFFKFSKTFRVTPLVWANSSKAVIFKISILIP